MASRNRLLQGGRDDQRTSDADRIGALIDGVFAIAITLLVIEIALLLVAALTAIIYNLIWNYTSRQPSLLRDDVEAASLGRTVRWNLILGPTVWGVTILIALVNSTLPIVLIFIGGIVWLVWSGVPPAKEPATT